MAWMRPFTCFARRTSNPAMRCSSWLPPSACMRSSRRDGSALMSRAVRSGFRFPLENTLQHRPATRMIAIASPNNPTGTVARREELLQIANAAPDAALLVDEAYYEFHGRPCDPGYWTPGNLFVAEPFPRPTDWPACVSACFAGNGADARLAANLLALQRERCCIDRAARGAGR